MSAEQVCRACMTSPDPLRSTFHQFGKRKPLAEGWIRFGVCLPFCHAVMFISASTLQLSEGKGTNNNKGLRSQLL